MSLPFSLQYLKKKLIKSIAEVIKLNLKIGNKFIRFANYKKFQLEICKIEGEKSVGVQQQHY